MIAFGVESVYDRVVKDDPNHVEWVAEMIDGDGSGLEHITYLGTRICTDEDWAKFDKEDKDAHHRIEHIKGNGSMHCLTGYDEDGNWVDLHVSGDSETVPHRRLEINFMPCHPKRLTKENKDENCVVDFSDPANLQKKLQEDKNYVGGSDFMLMVN
jgi:hypothetical protein